MNEVKETTESDHTSSSSETGSEKDEGLERHSELITQQAKDDLKWAPPGVKISAWNQTQLLFISCNANIRKLFELNPKQKMKQFLKQNLITTKFSLKI